MLPTSPTYLLLFIILLTTPSFPQLITYQTCQTNANCIHPRLSTCISNKCQPCTTASHCSQFGLTSQCLNDGVANYCTLPCNSVQAPDICAPINALCIDSGGYICDACETAADCEAQYPAGVQCHTLEGVGYCGFCLSHDQCPSQHTCRNFRCTECKSNVECPADRPVCDLGLKTYTCKCLVDSDCPAEKPSCAKASNKDVNACYVLPTLKLIEGERAEIVYLKFNKAMMLSRNIEEIFEAQLLNVDSSNFAYEIISLNTTTYKLMLKINTNIYNPQLTIKIIQPKQLLDVDYLQLSQTVYTMNLDTIYLLPESQAESAENFASMAKVLIIIILSVSILAIFFRKDSFMIWVTINLIQANYYLLFIKVEYPLHAQMFLRSLSISTFKFLPNIIATDSETLQEYIQKSPHGFAEDGISDKFLLALGHMLLLWIIIVSPIALIAVSMKYLVLPKRIEPIFYKIKAYFIWSGVLRLAIACYNELMFASFLQVMNLSFDSAFDVISSLLGILATIFCIITPFLFLPLLKRNIGFSTRDKARFGMLVHEYNYEFKAGRFHLAIVLFRQLLIALFTVFGHSSPLTVALVLISLDIASMMLLGLRPFKARLHNVMNSANEILSLFSHFLVLSLILDEYEGKPEGEIRIWTAWGIIGAMSTLLFMCTGIVVYEAGKSAKNLFDKCKSSSQARANSEPTNRLSVSTAHHPRSSISTVHYPRSSIQESQKGLQESHIDYLGVAKPPSFDDMLSSSHLSIPSTDFVRNRSFLLNQDSGLNSSTLLNSSSLLNNSGLVGETTFGKTAGPFKPIHDQDLSSYRFSLAAMRNMNPRKRQRANTPSKKQDAADDTVLPKLD